MKLICDLKINIPAFSCEMDIDFPDYFCAELLALQDMEKDGLVAVSADQIEVLPPSPMDDRIRTRLFRAIYGYPALEKYALGVQKPIRIIVKNGRVNLEGVVDNETDKNLAGLRANGVSGIFSVTNNLQVVKD